MLSYFFAGKVSLSSRQEEYDEEGVAALSRTFLILKWLANRSPNFEVHQHRSSPAPRCGDQGGGGTTSPADDAHHFYEEVRVTFTSGVVPLGGGKKGLCSARCFDSQEHCFSVQKENTSLLLDFV